MARWRTVRLARPWRPGENWDAFCAHQFCFSGRCLGADWRAGPIFVGMLQYHARHGAHQQRLGTLPLARLRVPRPSAPPRLRPPSRSRSSLSRHWDDRRMFQEVGRMGCHGSGSATIVGNAHGPNCPSVPRPWQLPPVSSHCSHKQAASEGTWYLWRSNRR